jgi:hypothetical protein
MRLSEDIVTDTAKFSFELKIRDRAHFYKIVNWLNNNLGKGKNVWTMDGRILRSLRNGQEKKTKVSIFNTEVDTSSTALFLSLL